MTRKISRKSKKKESKSSCHKKCKNIENDQGHSNKEQPIFKYIIFTTLKDIVQILTPQKEPPTAITPFKGKRDKMFKWAQHLRNQNIQNKYEKRIIIDLQKGKHFIQEELL